MKPIENKRSNHHKGHNTEGTVPVQTNSQKDARKQEIVSAPSMQATDQEEERGSNKERIKWKAKSNSADHVGPISDTHEDEGEESNALSADLFPEQINEWQSQKAEDGCA